LTFGRTPEEAMVCPSTSRLSSPMQQAAECLEHCRCCLVKVSG
jgi:hypothetical protein